MKIQEPASSEPKSAKFGAEFGVEKHIPIGITVLRLAPIDLKFELRPSVLGQAFMKRYETDGKQPDVVELHAWLYLTERSMQRDFEGEGASLKLSRKDEDNETLSPIFMPSSGRPNTVRLNLHRTMTSSSGFDFPGGLTKLEADWGYVETGATWRLGAGLWGGGNSGPTGGPRAALFFGHLPPPPYPSRPFRPSCGPRGGMPPTHPPT